MKKHFLSAEAYEHVEKLSDDQRTELVASGIRLFLKADVAESENVQLLINVIKDFSTITKDKVLASVNPNADDLAKVWWASAVELVFLTAEQVENPPKDENLTTENETSTTENEKPVIGETSITEERETSLEEEPPLPDFVSKERWLPDGLHLAISLLPQELRKEVVLRGVQKIAHDMVAIDAFAHTAKMLHDFPELTNEVVLEGTSPELMEIAKAVLSLLRLSNTLLINEHIKKTFSPRIVLPGNLGDVKLDPNGLTGFTDFPFGPTKN